MVGLNKSILVFSVHETQKMRFLHFIILNGLQTSPCNIELGAVRSCMAEALT